MRCASEFEFESISGIRTMNRMLFFSASRVVSCRAVCSSHIDHVRVAVGFRFVPLSRSISHANQSHLLLLLFNIRAGAKFLHSVVDYNESVATINSCSPKRLTKNNSVSNFFCSGEGWVAWEGWPSRDQDQFKPIENESNRDFVINLSEE